MHDIVQEYTHVRHKKWKEKLQLGIKFSNTYYGKNSLAIFHKGNAQFYMKHIPIIRGSYQKDQTIITVITHKPFC